MRGGRAVQRVRHRVVRQRYHDRRQRRDVPLGPRQRVEDQLILVKKQQHGRDGEDHERGFRARPRRQYRTRRERDERGDVTHHRHPPHAHGTHGALRQRGGGGLELGGGPARKRAEPRPLRVHGPLHGPTSTVMHMTLTVWVRGHRRHLELQRERDLRRETRADAHEPEARLLRPRRSCEIEPSAVGVKHRPGPALTPGPERDTQARQVRHEHVRHHAR